MHHRPLLPSRDARRILVAIAAMLGALAPLATPRVAAAQAATPLPARLELHGGLRVRAERWNWFDEGEAGEYLFAGALARLGVERVGGERGFRLELAVPALLRLPDDAVQPAPAGQLGLGGTYAAANFGEENVAQLFPKNAYVRLTRSRLRVTQTLRVGRFEFNDGTEGAPASSTVATIKRDRIAQRLLGTFGWSHVGRSLDGAHWSRKENGGDMTVVVAAPTRGVFQADGWGTLPIGVAYGSWTRPVSPGGESSAEVRLFALQYADFRDDVVKTDARPLVDRAEDDDRIHVTTLGGHWVHAIASRRGVVDVTLWGAGQLGSWGAQSHRAWAGVAELGVQPTGMSPLRPWLRGGIAYGSGDGDPADDRHGTFFQVLPTPRPYARFPFYDMQNSTDVYAILTLRPLPSFTLRGEAHGIRLSSGEDLWYSGGGAFQMRSFGYQGRPTGGEENLARLLDLSAELRITPDFVVTGYVSRARARRAMRVAYPTVEPGTLMYLEVERRF